MVNNLLILLKKYTFEISLYLFFIVVSFFLLSIVVYYIERLIKKIKSLKEKKYYDFVYNYLFGRAEINQYHSRNLKKDVLIDIFSRIISQITGEKQELLKNAVRELALIDVIIRNFHSIFPSKRIKSSYLLGLLGLKEHAQLLLPLLYDHNVRVVSSAIVALGELREESTVRELVSIFPFCREVHAWLISAILPFFGPDIYKYIKSLLKPDFLPPRRLVLIIKVISNLQIRESIKDLEPIFEKSQDLDVKISALIAIGKINDLLSVKIVLKALEDPNWQVRAVAANIIGDMALKGAVYRLIPLLNDKNWFVRKNAANAVVKMGKLGVHTLLNYLNQNDRFARDIIVQALEENGVVDRAVNDILSGNERAKSDGEFIIKMILAHGYVKYLENFTKYPIIKSLLENREPVQV